MASADTNIADNIGGGFGGGGPILLLLFLGFLFKGRDHGHHDGHKWEGDETNWAQDARRGHVQLAHELRNADENRRTELLIRDEAGETRALIREEAEKNLRDRLAEKNMEITKLQGEMFAWGLHSKTRDEIGEVKAMIGGLMCGLP